MKIFERRCVTIISDRRSVRQTQSAAPIWPTASSGVPKYLMHLKNAVKDGICAYIKSGPEPGIAELRLEADVTVRLPGGSAESQKQLILADRGLSLRAVQGKDKNCDKVS